MCELEIMMATCEVAVTTKYYLLMVSPDTSQALYIWKLLLSGIIKNCYSHMGGEDSSTTGGPQKEDSKIINLEEKINH